MRSGRRRCGQRRGEWNLVAFAARSIYDDFMTIELTSRLGKLVEKRVKAGQYASAADVITAGLAALEAQEAFAQLPTDVLKKLIAEGDESLKTEGGLTLEESYQQHLKHRQKRLRQRKSA